MPVRFPVLRAKSRDRRAGGSQRPARTDLAGSAPHRPAARQKDSADERRAAFFEPPRTPAQASRAGNSAGREERSSGGGPERGGSPKGSDPAGTGWVSWRPAGPILIP